MNILHFRLKAEGRRRRAEGGIIFVYMIEFLDFMRLRAEGGSR